MQAKRLKRQELFAREGLSWAKVVQFFTQQLEKKEHQREPQELKQLLQAAKQIGTVFQLISGKFMHFVLFLAIIVLYIYLRRFLEFMII